MHFVVYLLALSIIVCGFEITQLIRLILFQWEYVNIKARRLNKMSVGMTVVTLHVYVRTLHEESINVEVGERHSLYKW
jgi:hypothetical protein